MTPAEIAALRALCQTDPGLVYPQVPALLSALEEARADLVKASEERASWQSAALTAGRFREAERARAEAAESALEEARAALALVQSGSDFDRARADALQRERDEMEKSKWCERDRRKEAEARADALQAEVERANSNAAAYAASAAEKHDEIQRQKARADAAWRAALEAAAQRAEAEEELDGPMPESVRRMAQQDPCGMLRGAVRATKKGIAVGIRALPPPSATAAPAEECDCRIGIPLVHRSGCRLARANAHAEKPRIFDASVLAPPAEEEKCPGCGTFARTMTDAHGFEGPESCPACGGTGRAPSRGEVG